MKIHTTAAFSLLATEIYVPTTEDRPATDCFSDPSIFHDRSSYLEHADKGIIVGTQEAKASAYRLDVRSSHHQMARIILEDKPPDLADIGKLLVEMGKAFSPMQAECIVRWLNKEYVNLLLAPLMESNFFFSYDAARKPFILDFRGNTDKWTVTSLSFDNRIEWPPNTRLFIRS